MSALERKYSTKEAAEIVHCSENTVRRRFRDDPRCGRLGSKEARNKRAYLVLLIPESALVKWWDELKQNRA